MILTTLLPQPPDYEGTLWALAGVRSLQAIFHGAAGCTFYDSIIMRSFDPTRWAGPLHTSGLTEPDIITGGEERLAEAVLAVDRRHRPEVIALVNTTVAALMGTDPHAVARELQPRVDARLIAFSGGGMRGLYPLGISEALATLIRELTEPVAGRPAGPPTVNLVGPTVDAFNLASDLTEVRRLLALLGVTVRLVTSDTDVAAYRQAGQAHLNLVLRDVGLAAAEALEQRCGTPYLYGIPFGSAGTRAWLLAVAERLGIEGAERQIAADSRLHPVRLGAVSPWHEVHGRLRVAVAAPYDYALGLTRLLAEEWHLQVPLVVLPVAPLVSNAVDALRKAGAQQVLVEPDEEALGAALGAAEPHVLMGSAEDSRLAPGVPVHIRAARPSYDCLQFHNGTPFVGHGGVRWLAQSLVNGMYAAGPAGIRL